MHNKIRVLLSLMAFSLLFSTSSRSEVTKADCEGPLQALYPAGKATFVSLYPEDKVALKDSFVCSISIEGKCQLSIYGDIRGTHYVAHGGRPAHTIIPPNAEHIQSRVEVDTLIRIIKNNKNYQEFEKQCFP